MLKCVMIDWGDVLFDEKTVFDEVIKKVTFNFWKENGFKGSLEEYRKLDHKTTHEMLDMQRKNNVFKKQDWPMIFAKNAGLKISEDTANREFEEFFNYYTKHPRLFPESKSILKFIKSKRLYLALVSNNWKDAYKAFERSGVTKYFDAMVVSEEVNCLKSHLKPFEFVLEKLKLKPEECLMVGDFPEEDGACKKLGIRFCLLDRERKYDKDGEFDFRIENLKELKNIIQELLS